MSQDSKNFIFQLLKIIIYKEKTMKADFFQKQNYFHLHSFQRSTEHYFFFLNIYSKLYFP